MVAVPTPLTAETTGPHFCFVLPPTERYNARGGGAVATVTKELARELLKLGHRVTILTPDDGAPVYEVGCVRRMCVGPAHPWVSALSRLHAIAAYRTHRKLTALRPYLMAVRSALRQVPEIDVLIIANDVDAANHLNSAARACVLWLHNYLEGPEAANLPSLASSIQLVTVSDALARWTSDRYGLARERMTVVHNGIDSETFKPVRAAGDVQHPLRVICYGRIDPNKGNDIAARAVADLRRHGRSAEIYLYGEVKTFGWPEEEVTAYVARLDSALLAAGTRRLGRVDHSDIPALLADSDVACFLPRSEDPFPLAVLEAMAAGCAVVVRPSGGIAEMVGDAAVLVGNDAPEEVAAAIEGFMDHPERLAAAKRAARERASGFTWEQSARTFVSSLKGHS